MEHEVTGHTRKIYRIAKNKEHGFWHKLKEICIEIFIIVFAVTLSIWLHGKSEHSHQQKEVKEFMAGLKTDIESDIKEMENDLYSFEQARNAFSFLTRARFEQSLSKDSLTRYQSYLNNITEFIPNNGRYEGFKSAGKLTNIENKELQDNILSFFQEDVPALASSSRLYNMQKQKLGDVIVAMRKTKKDGSDNLEEVLVSDPVQNIAATLTRTEQIEGIYRLSISRAKAIIEAIDAENH